MWYSRYFIIMVKGRVYIDLLSMPQLLQGFTHVHVLVSCLLVDENGRSHCFNNRYGLNSAVPDNILCHAHTK